ncbi:ankyrin repeats (3 copies) domain-containing protein [Phthorimaea operculella]|nr:ankyrin repeats (3 copies) domain-containing protein [Phthorimaea operculella]
MEEKLLLLCDVSTSLRERVFFAARDGMSLTLYALLYEKSTDEIDEVLNSDVCCDGVKCTPLIAAARHGREGAVRILLEKFRPPVRLETEGTVKFDEYVIEGATALWCAAGAGHLGIVKRLVRAGANVNHSTKTLSTPLRAACFDGRLDIVKYLVRHGADIHKANKYNNTCLMIAAYKGHLDVVQFLLDSGARVDERALCGATALHFAAECGHAAIVCALIDHNAKILSNENGMTPLQCAAERARASVVEILAARPEVTRAQAIEAYELLGASFANDKEYYCLRAIEAYELLGASFANDKEYYCLRMAYQYLHRAMAMRYDTRYGLLLKKPADPIPAYDNWRESTTLEDVERIHNQAHSLHMEGLAVRERILGRACPDLPHPVVFRGAVFADEARFDRLHMEGLAVRERILGRACPDLPHPVVFRGAVFADEARFHRLHMEGLAVRERILGRACPDLPHPVVFRGAVFADEARFHRLHMEGLAVRERILGRACPDLPHPVVFRGAVFADEARFDRLHMEGLAVRERILGRACPDLPHPVVFRGAVFADEARFHRLHMEGLAVRERILGRACPDLPHPVVFRGAVFADEARFHRLHMEGLAVRERILGRACPDLPHPVVFRGAVFADEARFHRLHMEGLAVRERILGRACPDLPHPVVFRGAVFADEARFHRCLALWRHALELRLQNKVSVVKDLLRFAQVFSQMIHIGIELPLQQVCYVLEACAQELRRLEKPQPSHDPDSLMEEYESNVRTALYLVAVAGRLLEDPGNSEETIRAVRTAIFNLRGARLRTGQTLLHLACDRRTPVDDFHTSDVCQFPCHRTTKLLLDCGVDVDASDDTRRTALHVVLISYQLLQDRESWSEAVCNVVCELVLRGAHTDAMDINGITPLVAAMGSPAEMIIRAALSPRLTCLAASALARARRTYSPQQVPRSLHAFLAMHGVMQTGQHFI